MKRINLFGALWVVNFGDVLLADLFQRKLQSLGYQVSFPFLPENVAEEIGATSSGIREILDADHNIFIGGGYLSEPPKNPSRWALSRYKKIFGYADLLKALGKPYSIVCVGAGPCESVVTRYLVKRFCDRSELLVVRDQESHDTLCSIGVTKRPHILSDFAFSLGETNSKVTMSVGLHLSANLSEINDEVIRHFKAAPYEAWFIEDKPGEFQRVRAAHPDIDSVVGNRVLQYEGHWKLVEKLSQFEFVLTSKLHVGIVAASLGKKICSIPYHDKVFRLYAELRRPEICLPARTIKHGDQIKRHIEKCLNADPVDVPLEFSRRLLGLDGLLVRAIEDGGRQR